MTDDFTPLSPQRWTARELRGVAGRGLSSPLFVDCVNASGQRRRAVLKLRDPQTADRRPWHLCLVRDLVGTVIARHLGLTVPDYAIVEIDQSFALSTARHTLGGRIAANVGANFGTTLIDAVTEAGDGATEDWAPVLGFDSLGFNADRKTGNPNALWTGSRLYLIDHGMLAPTWTFDVDGTTSSTLFGTVNIKLHAAYAVVKGRAPDFLTIANQWSTCITSEFLAWLRIQVPASWASARDVNDLFAFLEARSSIIRQQEQELRGIVG